MNVIFTEGVTNKCALPQVNKVYIRQSLLECSFQKQNGKKHFYILEHSYIHLNNVFFILFNNLFKNWT